MDTPVDAKRGKTQPRLYIIMRKDIYQMNPGKLAAQACHAQALFDVAMYNAPSSNVLQAVAEWQGALGFGTTITLEATLSEIEELIDYASIDNMLPAQYGVVTDPTYPFCNFFGEQFTCSEVTCMYIFVYDATSLNITTRLKQFLLHP